MYQISLIDLLDACLSRGIFRLAMRLIPGDQILDRQKFEDELLDYLDLVSILFP